MYSRSLTTSSSVRLRACRCHTRLAQHRLARREPDPEDVGQSDLDPLLAGQVDACDSPAT